MSFLAELQSELQAGREKIVDPVVREIRSRCLEAASKRLTEVVRLSVPHPLAEVWKDENDKGESCKRIIEAIKEKLEGITDLRVEPSVGGGAFIFSGKWSGTHTPGEPSLVAELNKANEAAAARLEKAAADTRAEAIADLLAGFRRKCLERAKSGISSARHEATFSDHVQTSEGTFNRWALITERGGIAKLRSTLQYELDALGLPGAQIELDAMGKLLGVKYPKPSGNYCLITAQRYSSCLTSGVSVQKQCAVCLHKGGTFQRTWHVAVSYDDDGVQLVGERTRVERDTELRKRAIDVEGASSSTSPSPVPAPKAPKRE